MAMSVWHLNWMIQILYSYSVHYIRLTFHKMIYQKLVGKCTAAFMLLFKVASKSLGKTFFYKNCQNVRRSHIFHILLIKLIKYLLKYLFSLLLPFFNHLLAAIDRCQWNAGNVFNRKKVQWLWTLVSASNMWWITTGFMELQVTQIFFCLNIKLKKSLWECDSNGWRLNATIFVSLLERYVRKTQEWDTTERKVVSVNFENSMH